MKPGENRNLAGSVRIVSGAGAQVREILENNAVFFGALIVGRI